MRGGGFQSETVQMCHCRHKKPDHTEHLQYVCSTSCTVLCTANEFMVYVKKQYSIGGYKEHKWDRNRAGKGMSYRPAGPYREAESIPGLLKSLKTTASDVYKAWPNPQRKEYRIGLR